MGHKYSIHEGGRVSGDTNIHHIKVERWVAHKHLHHGPQFVNQNLNKEKFCTEQVTAFIILL